MIRRIASALSAGAEDTRSPHADIFASYLRIAARDLCAALPNDPRAKCLASQMRAITGQDVDRAAYQRAMQFFAAEMRKIADAGWKPVLTSAPEPMRVVRPLWPAWMRLVFGGTVSGA